MGEVGKERKGGKGDRVRREKRRKRGKGRRKSERGSLCLFFWPGVISADMLFLPDWAIGGNVYSCVPKF